MPLSEAKAPNPVETSLGDEILLECLRQGETNAGEMLARRYFQPLMRYLQRLTGNDHVAEELHQQTWLSVLSNLDRFDSTLGGGFKAWLFRIATNKANDHWRQNGREKAIQKNLRMTAEDHVPPPADRMQETEQDQKLRLEIERLPDNQKQVVLLRYYANLKFVEIARVLGCPLNTALGRMHKAMMKLRQVMD